jgi:DNA-binding transcriptional MerR regulator
MASRMLTLFGDEMIPEEMQVVPKVSAKDPQSGSPKDSPDSKQHDGGTPLGAVILAGWKPQKQYYTIGEVADLFGVRTSHIRYWTTAFELKVRTTRKGDRLYTPTIIAELRNIYHLVKERGFTIPGARAKLKETQNTTINTLDLRQALLQLRNQLLLIRNQLL